MVPWEQYVSLAPGDGLAELAGFVTKSSEEMIAAAGLSIPAADVLKPMRARRADVERAFDVLAHRTAEGIHYRYEDTDDFGYQVVRSWQRITHQGATCLDLAILACTQLRHAQLRPYLVLDFVGDHQESGHALVLVNLAADYASPEPLWPAGVTGGGASGTSRWNQPGEQTEEWLLYDPTEACRQFSREFARAESSAWHRLRSPGHSTWLVDLAVALSDDRIHRAPPLATTAWGLSRHCPALPDVIEFPSRRALKQRLRARRGTTVIAGPRGVGKSVCALDAATAATGGAGWFLNGSSTQSLIASLAEAEAYEQGAREKVGFDIDGYARSALSRLANIAGPWVVVVDNADVSPSTLRQWLPVPDPTHGQHLIVTTTDHTASGEFAGWEMWASKNRAGLDDGTSACEVLHISDISEDEARAQLEAAAGARLELPAALPELVRRPLVLHMVTALLLTEHDAEARAVLASEKPIATYWRVLRDLLDDGADGPTCRRLARALAALPRVAVPASVIEALAPDARRHVSRLVSLGLLTEAGQQWSLHGLLASEIVGDGDHAADVSELLCQVLPTPTMRTLLRTSFDYATLSALAGVLEHARLTDDQRCLTLANLAEIVDERGTQKQARAMARRLAAVLPAAGFDDLRAAALLAEARFVNQHLNEAAEETGRPKHEVLADAIDKAALAESLARDESRRGKAIAMRGLLTKALAGAVRDRPDPERLDLLLQAEQLILEGLVIRKQLFGADPHHPEVAKALFNVGGISLELAKARPALAEQKLATAREAYTSVEATRRFLFPHGAHRHIASCVAGLGLVDYYEALLIAKQVHRDHAEDAASAAQAALPLLSSAFAHLTAALVDREVIEGDDGDDVRKTLKALLKVAGARLTLATGSYRLLHDSEDGVIPELDHELTSALSRLHPTDALLLPQPTPPPEAPTVAASELDSAVS